MSTAKRLPKKFLTVLSLLLLGPTLIWAEDSQTTFAIFTGSSLRASDWPSLENALRQEQALHAPSMAALAGLHMRIVHGETMPPGIAVDSAISVFLSGNCSSGPIPFLQGHAPAGVLGWVVRKQGTVQPFIHVNCDHIIQLLTPHIVALNPDQQRHVVAVAVARVILHEWIHIATQSSHHSEHGLTRSNFTAQDLMAPVDEVVAQSRTAPRIKRGEQMP